MKNHIFLAIGILLLLSIPIQAQNFKFGVRGGLNISSLDVDPAHDTSSPNSRLGFHLGGFALFDLAEGLHLQPEVTLSAEGVNYEDNEVYEKAKLTYLNLSGMFKYYFDNRISIFAGPRIGLLAGGEFEEEDKIEGEIDVYNASDVYKGLDFSLGFGAGYTFDPGIEISVRYNLGLTDNNDDPMEMAFYEVNQKVRSRVFQVSVSYIFNR